MAQENWASRFSFLSYQGLSLDCHFYGHRTMFLNLPDDGYEMDLPSSIDISGSDC